MGKFSVEDKLRIQTLSEQRMGAKAVKSAYPEKNWSLSTLKAICRQIDATGSAVYRQGGSGRPKRLGTAANVAKVGELIKRINLGLAKVHATLLRS